MSLKLQKLTAHLLKQNLCHQEDVDSWVDSCRITPEARHKGEYSEIGQMVSSCTLFFERYPDDSRKILALVSGWLQDNDPDRDQVGLADPQINVTPLDKSGCSFDVDISLDFTDPIMVQVSADGDIFWQGKRWKLIDKPLVTTAEEVDGVNPNKELQNNG